LLLSHQAQRSALAEVESANLLKNLEARAIRAKIGSKKGKICVTNF
jgi:hypothetical protein